MSLSHSSLLKTLSCDGFSDTPHTAPWQAGSLCSDLSIAIPPLNLCGLRKCRSLPSVPSFFFFLLSTSRTSLVFILQQARIYKWLQKSLLSKVLLSIPASNIHSNVFTTFFSSALQVFSFPTALPLLLLVQPFDLLPRFFNEWFFKIINPPSCFFFCLPAM